MSVSHFKTSQASTETKASVRNPSDPKKPPKSIPPPPTSGENKELGHRFLEWVQDKDVSGEKLDASLSDRLGLRRCWIDMARDHAAATMLAQIVYWCFIPSKETGKNKLTINKHGSQWLAKSDREWWEECRLTRSQVDRILEQFRGVGWIKTKTMRFNGSPTTHISAMWPLVHSWQKAVDNPTEFSGK